MSGESSPAPGGDEWVGEVDSRYAVIGQPVALLGAAARACGSSGLLDELVPAGCLYASALAHGGPSRFDRLDAARARRRPGVRALLCASDLSGRVWAGGAVLHAGETRASDEPVVAVAADTPDQAEAALGLDSVRVRFAPEAGRGGAQGPEAEALPGPVLRWDEGDLASARAESVLVVEDTFTFAPVAAPEAPDPICAAAWDAEGACTLWSTGPAPFVTRDRLAQALGLAVDRVRVVTGACPAPVEPPGGIRIEELLVALLARAAGRPVRWTHLRGRLGTRRSPRVSLRLRSGARSDGTFTFREARAEVEVGRWVGERFFTPRRLGCALFTAYRVPARSVEVRVTPSSVPHPVDLPGAGYREAAFAVESQLQALAANLGMDSVSLRTRNCGRLGPEASPGQRLTAVAVAECARRAAETVGWCDKHATVVLRKADLPTASASAEPVPVQEPGSVRRGVGIGVSLYPAGAQVSAGEGSSAAVLLDEGARVTVVSSAADPGRGVDTLFAQIAAEVLALPVARVTVVRPDTRTAPWDAGGDAGRAVFVGGNAVRAAASDLRERVIAVAARLLNVRAEQVSLAFGKVYVPHDPAKSLPLEIFLERAGAAGAGSFFAGQGSYRPGAAAGDEPGAILGAVGCAAEVEVDGETGRVRVVRLVAVQDVGKILHPWLQEAHLQADVVCALARAVAVDVDEAGRAPRVDQAPRVETRLIETLDADGPFGAKGAAGSGGVPVAAAVANAIADALGVRVTAVPITPAAIRAALRAAGPGRARAEAASERTRR